MKDIDELAETLVESGLPYVCISGRVIKERLTGTGEDRISHYLEYEIDWMDKEKEDYHIRLFKNFHDLQAWVGRLKNEGLEQ